MNKSWHISRRRMLRGVSAAMALPYLEMMGDRSISIAGIKQHPTARLCYLYFPNGVADGAWQPAATGNHGELRKLNRWMHPLEPLKRDITIFHNIWTPRGNGHGAGTATWLTGHGYDEKRIDAGGVSADQIAAQHLGKQTLLPSLELSLQGEGFFSRSLVRNTISWVNRKTPAPRDVEPRIVFDRMFRTRTNAPITQAVLDQVLEDARDLKRQAGAEDVRKIDEYLDSVRSIERRIQFSGKQTKRLRSQTALQERFNRPEQNRPKEHREYVRLMLDMIVLAFWADATRVCTLMLDHGQSNRYFNFIDNVHGTWHALSHWKDASGKTEDDDGVTSWTSAKVKRDMYNRVTEWHHEQIAYFLNRLKHLDERGTSLLDRSLVLYGSSLADGHDHSARNLPLLLAGGGCGNVKPGRLLQMTEDTSLSRLHLSMLHAAGIDATRFGDADEALHELHR